MPKAQGSFVETIPKTLLSIINGPPLSPCKMLKTLLFKLVNNFMKNRLKIFSYISMSYLLERIELFTNKSQKKIEL
jgi:hypothetical protein